MVKPENGGLVIHLKIRTCLLIGLKTVATNLLESACTMQI